MTNTLDQNIRASAQHLDELVRHRRSIRHFTSAPVSTKDIREILALASMAPNVGNRQCWRFIVVADENLRRMLAGLVERQINEMAVWPQLLAEPTRIQALKRSALHFAQAPATIFIIDTGYHHPLERALVEHGMKLWECEHLVGHPDYQSVGGVIAYLTLLAEARGYGACWITDALVAKKDLHAALELKPGEQIAALVTMGTPAESPIPKPRRAIDELIEWR